MVMIANSAVPRPIDDDVDASIAGVARGRLADCEYRSVRRIDCQVVDGVVILVGSVSSYYLKQVAQTAVSHIPGARGIVNLLEVQESLPVAQN